MMMQNERMVIRIMKWADFNLCETKHVVLGFWLTTLNIDLEQLPKILFEKFEYKEIELNKRRNQHPERVRVDAIKGTGYSDYGDKVLLAASTQLRRAGKYISEYRVTRDKYFYRLKKPVNQQSCPIKLLKDKNGDYWVEGNGNHRVIMYKLMMLAEISNVAEWVRRESYDTNSKTHESIRQKYWLNANVCDEE